MNNLTQREKMKLRKNNICPICGEVITEFDDCTVVKTPYSKYIAYNFFHTKCLIKKYENRMNRINSVS